MDNLQIAKILHNIAEILEIDGVKWKPQAYQRVARTIETLSEDINLVYKEGKLYELPGIGEHIGKKIEELINTGKLKYYEKLKKEIKFDFEQLSQILNLGPKKMKVLYQKLRIKTVQDLEQAIKKKKLRKLSGFGVKSEQDLLDGIKLLRTKPKKFSRKDVKVIAIIILKKLRVLPFVSKVVIAGSYRRKKELVGDLDVLVVSNKSLLVMDMFTTLKNNSRILVKGPTKSSILLNNGLQVDLRVVKAKAYGAALMYFTGSKEHNLRLRRIALKKGLTLNEYALTEVATKKWVAGRTEAGIYKKLGLKYVDPEKRVN